MTGGSVSEFVEYPIAVGLLHLRVDVEAAVAKLCDLLREKLHSIHGVAEDDALVDIKLSEQSVKAVDFLLLLHERIELRNSAEGELVHEVDDVGVGEELLLEALYGHRESSGE